jgi:signal transduction histidine kinase
VNQPVDALGLLSRALRHRTTEGESGVILDEVEQCLGQLRGQLASMFDVVRAEHCLVSFDQNEILLMPILEKLALQLSRLAHDKQVQLSIVPTSARVISDPMALEVILRTLLVNGLLFASGGRLLVGCRTRGDALELQVWGSSQGDLPENHAIIFDHLHDVQAGGDGRMAGLRLGLTMVRDLARTLGHGLDLRCEQPAGLVFSLVLPRTPA